MVWNFDDFDSIKHWASIEPQFVDSYLLVHDSYQSIQFNIPNFEVSHISMKELELIKLKSFEKHNIIAGQSCQIVQLYPTVEKIMAPPFLTSHHHPLLYGYTLELKKNRSRWLRGMS